MKSVISKWKLLMILISFFPSYMSLNRYENDDERLESILHSSRKNCGQIKDETPYGEDFIGRCGIEPEPEPDKFGHFLSKMPWIVYLADEDYKWKCWGTLITKEHVVVTRRCAEDLDKKKTRIHFNGYKNLITHQIYSDDRVYRVLNGSHGLAGVRFSEFGVGYDLSVIRLSEKFEVSETDGRITERMPACLLYLKISYCREVFTISSINKPRRGICSEKYRWDLKNQFLFGQQKAKFLMPDGSPFNYKVKPSYNNDILVRNQESTKWTEYDLRDGDEGLPLMYFSHISKRWFIVGVHTGVTGMCKYGFETRGKCKPLPKDSALYTRFSWGAPMLEYEQEYWDYVLPSDRGYCGISGGRNPVKGDTKNTRYPWSALIVVSFFNGTSTRCSGALVSHREVITSASCLVSSSTSSYKVYIGHVVYNDIIRAQSGYDVEKFEKYYHRDNRNSYKMDIAIVTLTKEVPFTDGIVPICLSDEKIDHRFQKARVPLWGEYFPEANFDQLSVITVYNLNYTVYDIGLIDLVGHHRDYCSGDNGAPLTYKSKKTGRYFMLGVLIHRQGGCVEKYSDGFHKVTFLTTNSSNNFLRERLGDWFTNFDDDPPGGPLNRFTPIEE